MRYNKSLNKDTVTGTALRRACPYVMPCEPPDACSGNGTCSNGYVSYYTSYRSDSLCDPLHFTLNNGLCFAPRCGLCDISEENPHFRLEGECVACPAIAWLLPAMMGFGALCAGISMIVLAKSKVTRNVLRIGVDYFQVLAMFRTAKVAWSIEVEFALKYLQFFQLDIDLTAPECAFRGIVTYETKFYLKVSLPLLAGALVGVVFFLKHCVDLARKTFKTFFFKRKAASFKNIQTREVPGIAYVTNLVLTMAYFLYLTVCRAAFDVLNCKDTLPSTGRLYMASQPLEECYVEGGMQNRLMPVAVLVLLIYGAGLPLVILSTFCILRKRIQADQILRVHEKGDTYETNENLGIRSAFGQMYSMFQPQCYLWAVTIMFRKLLLCAVGVMFKDNPTYHLAGTLAIMFGAFIMQVKASPFLDVKERARIMRDEAEKKILEEVLKLERQSMLVRAGGTSYAELMHSMRSQMDAQDKIMSRHRADVFNLNAVELTLLACAVFLCLSGIMFDSPFLGQADAPMRGTVLALVSISVVVFSILYFIAAFGWEIKMSKAKKKTKRAVLWSKVKGFRKTIINEHRAAKTSGRVMITPRRLSAPSEDQKKTFNVFLNGGTKPPGNRSRATSMEERGILKQREEQAFDDILAIAGDQKQQSESDGDNGSLSLGTGTSSNDISSSTSSGSPLSDMTSSDEEHSFSAGSTNKTDSMSDVSNADEDDEDGSMDNVMETGFAFSHAGQEHLEVISGQRGNEDSSSKTVSDNDEDSGISGNSASSLYELSKYENSSVSSRHSMTESDSHPPQGDGGIVTAPKSKADENDDMPIIKPKPAHSIGQPSSDSSQADLTSSESDTRAGEDEGSEDEGLPIFTVDHLIAKPVLSTDSSSSDSSTSDSGSDSS